MALSATGKDGSDTKKESVEDMLAIFYKNTHSVHNI
jgi:hypothetical protein